MGVCLQRHELPLTATSVVHGSWSSHEGQRCIFAGGSAAAGVSGGGVGSSAAAVSSGSGSGLGFGLLGLLSGGATGVSTGAPCSDAESRVDGCVSRPHAPSTHPKAKPHAMYNR